MEEIKLWLIGGPKDSPIVTDISSVAQTETEALLEETLVKSPNLLADGLKLVGRQIDTPGGPLDLLGVDENGRLVVFELKRGTLTRDAVSQVIDYASYLAELSLDKINSIVCANSGMKGIDKYSDLTDWYQGELKSSSSLGKPRMVLVGLGVDERARRMVDFLSSNDVEISLITFHGFNYNNDVVLARQIEVAQRQTVGETKYSKATNYQKLMAKIKTSGVETYFNAAAGLIRSIMNAYEWPNPSGYTYYLQDITDSGTPSNRAYLAVLVPEGAKGSIILSLQDRAIKAAGSQWATISQNWGARALQRKGYVEVRVSSDADWKEMEPSVSALCAAIVEGRKSLQEKSLQEEKAEVERGVVKELSEAQA